MNKDKTNNKAVDTELKIVLKESQCVELINMLINVVCPYNKHDLVSDMIQRLRGGVKVE